MKVNVYGLEAEAVKRWAAQSGISVDALIKQFLLELRTAGMVVLPKNLREDEQKR